MNNFRSVFDELSKLYEEAPKTEEKDLESEETVEESCSKKTLKEAVEDEDVVEIEDNEVVEEPAPEEIKDEPKQIVLECSKCGALVIKDEASLAIDEASDLVNIEDSCEYCEEAAGYQIIGAVSPYNVVEESELSEGIFDSKAEKERQLRKAISQELDIDVANIGFDIATATKHAISAMAARDKSKSRPKDVVTFLEQIKRKHTNKKQDDTHNTPLIKDILAFLSHRTSNPIDNNEISGVKQAITKIQECQKKLISIGTINKVGNKALIYAKTKVNNDILTELTNAQYISDFRQKHKVHESFDDVESDSTEELEEILDFDVPINITANDNNVAIGGIN